MMPKLYEAIEMAVASGVSTPMLPDVLIEAGWPPELVNQAVDAWLKAHGRKTEVTGFKVWLKQ